MRAVLAVVTLAAVLRFGLVALVAGDQQRVFNSDSYEFHRLARNLCETGQFSRDREPPFAPEVARTPLFPAVAAILYRISGSGYLVVLLLNAGLGVIIAWLLARHTGPAGPAAAALYAVDPTSVIYSSMYVAENLLTGLVLTAVLLLAHGLSAEGKGREGLVAVSGILGGLAVLAKPVATYLPLVLLPAALAFPRRRVGAARLLVLFLAGWGVVVVPWLLRNRQVAGIATVSSIQEINLLYWNVAVMEGRRAGLDRRGAEEELRQEVVRRTGSPYDELSTAGRLRALRAVALERILARPWAYLWVHLRGVPFTLLDPGRLDLSRMLGGVDWGSSLLATLTADGMMGLMRALLGQPVALLLPMTLIATWLVLLTVAAICGIVHLRRRFATDPFMLLAAAAGFYLTTIGGPIGNARFRVALVPFLVWFAAGGLRRRAKEDEPCRVV